jgi:hypothetical protein
MMSGDQIYVVLGIYLLVILFVLTMLGLMALSLVRISRHLSKIAEAVRKISERS